MQEIWKDIKGFENYQISNFGRIKSKERMVSNSCRTYFKKEEILKTHVMKSGYLAIVLRDKEQKKRLLKIHRLIAENFISTPNRYTQVNHIDGDKTNCAIENLEWRTPQQNTRHAMKNGLRRRYTGRNVQKIYQINSETKEIEKVHETFADAARSIGNNSVGSIYGACLDKRDYRGYFWIRESDFTKDWERNCKETNKKYSSVYRKKPAPQAIPKAQAKEKEPVKVEGEQELPDFMKAE